MKNMFVNSAAALAIAVATGGMAVTLSTAPAEAKVTQKWEYTNKDKCFKSVRVPATVEYNTKGKLKHAASRVWTGNPQKAGSIVRDKYNDAVYFQTRKVIEDQHVTLVPTKC